MRIQVQAGGALPALTSIRFLAALTVVLSHFTQLGLLNLSDKFISFVDGGRPAVTLFFVLSGFILTYTYHDSMGRGDIRRFYVARFARIYPVLVLSLVFAAPVTIYVLRPANAALLLSWYATKDHGHVTVIASLVAQLLLLTGWFPFAAINQPWNGPAWSISCEAFFYALFPWLLRKFMAKRLSTVTLICVGLWAFQGVWIFLMWHFMPVGRKGFLISQFPLTHLAEFITGIGAALHFLHVRRRGIATHRGGIALVCVSLAAIALVAAYQPIKPAYYLQSPLFSLLILGLALIQHPVLGVLHRRPLILLGEASFSLYLIHIPLAHIIQLTGIFQSRGWIALALSIGLSILVFRFFEEPIRKLIRRGFSDHQPTRAHQSSQLS
ncbi:acyltransferase family protein [Burkholderia vietnamiensis]|uniref:acyltransferase family protein n=1 Tax=Burkholderia vietnamiensis TaxID=60552 RepID=UPI0009BFD5CE|nr:acyltransferase [Burkholderia vietnamiensis]